MSEFASISEELAAAKASAERGRELIGQARLRIRQYQAAQITTLDSAEGALKCACAVLSCTTTTALSRFGEQRSALIAVLVQAIEASGFSVAGPTDVRAAEHGEPAWVCNARAAIAEVRD